MSQVTGAITLADGQATPANIAFNPEAITPALSTFVDRSSGISMSYRRLSVRWEPNKGTTGSRYSRNQFNVSYPVYGVLPSGASGVKYTLRANVTLDLPDGCTDAERKDIYAFAKNGLANALVTGALRDYDPMY